MSSNLEQRRRLQQSLSFKKQSKDFYVIQRKELPNLEQLNAKDRLAARFKAYQIPILNQNYKIRDILEEVIQKSNNAYKQIQFNQEQLLKQKEIQRQNLEAQKAKANPVPQVKPVEKSNQINKLKNQIKEQAQEKVAEAQTEQASINIYKEFDTSQIVQSYECAQDIVELLFNNLECVLFEDQVFKKSKKEAQAHQREIFNYQALSAFQSFDNSQQDKEIYKTLSYPIQDYRDNYQFLIKAQSKDAAQEPILLQHDKYQSYIYKNIFRKPQKQKDQAQIIEKVDILDKRTTKKQLKQLQKNYTFKKQNTKKISVSDLQKTKAASPSNQSPRSRKDINIIFQQEGQISYRNQIKETDSSSSLGKSFLGEDSREQIIKVKKVRKVENQKSQFKNIKQINTQSKFDQSESDQIWKKKQSDSPIKLNDLYPILNDKIQYPCEGLTVEQRQTLLTPEQEESIVYSRKRIILKHKNQEEEHKQNILKMAELRRRELSNESYQEVIADNSRFLFDNYTGQALDWTADTKLVDLGKKARERKFKQLTAMLKTSVENQPERIRVDPKDLPVRRRGDESSYESSKSGFSDDVSFQNSIIEQNRKKDKKSKIEIIDQNNIEFNFKGQNIKIEGENQKNLGPQELKKKKIKEHIQFEKQFLLRKQEEANQIMKNQVDPNNILKTILQKDKIYSDKINKMDSSYQENLLNISENIEPFSDRVKIKFKSGFKFGDVQKIGKPNPKEKLRMTLDQYKQLNKIRQYKDFQTLKEEKAQNQFQINENPIKIQNFNCAYNQSKIGSSFDQELYRTLSEEMVRFSGSPDSINNTNMTIDDTQSYKNMHDRRRLIQSQQVNRSFLNKRKVLQGVIKYNGFDKVQQQQYQTTVKTNASTEISVLKSIHDNLLHQMQIKSINQSAQASQRSKYANNQQNKNEEAQKQFEMQQKYIIDKIQRLQESSKLQNNALEQLLIDKQNKERRDHSQFMSVHPISGNTMLTEIDYQSSVCSPKQKNLIRNSMKFDKNKDLNQFQNSIISMGSDARSSLMTPNLFSQRQKQDRIIQFKK